LKENKIDSKAMRGSAKDFRKKPEERLPDDAIIFNLLNTAD